MKAQETLDNQPNPCPALPRIAWLKANDTGVQKRLLNSAQCARLRVSGAALDILD